MPLKSKILVIEDDMAIRQGLELLLGQEFDVVSVGAGLPGVKMAIRQKPNLILLDLMMPDVHGFEVCQTIREDGEFDQTPIIILTALNDTLERTKAYKLGADDFISKPFDNNELIARIRRKIEGIKPATKSPSPDRATSLSFENLHLDLSKQNAYVNQKLVHFSTIEFNLLRYFVEHPAVLLKREDIVNHVWAHASTTVRIIDPHIVAIRRKLKDFEGQITSVYREGYILKSK